MRWTVSAAAPLLATALLTACMPAGVSRIIDALNADIGPAQAFVGTGETVGIVKQMSLAWRSGDSPALKLSYRWCAAGNALASAEEECNKWERRTSYLVLNAIDPNSIKVEAGEDQPSVSFACEGDKPCARPSPIGIPCRDGLACQRVRDNLVRLVRFARGGTIEAPST
jgi:hypothetical protein